MSRFDCILEINGCRDFGGGRESESKNVSENESEKKYDRNNPF